MKFFLFLMIILTFFSCEEEREIERGERQQACYKDNTCVEGLKCEDNKCVDIYLTEEDIPDENFRKCLEEKYQTQGFEVKEVNLYNIIRSNSIGCSGVEGEDYKWIRDITGIKLFKNLEVLSLYNSRIENLNELSKSIKLKVLRINHSKIEDISFVRNLVNLEELYFTYNNISDLTPLASLTNLKVLWLDSNYIENIAPLNNLINLEKLIITYNCIEECALYYDHTENITKGECDKLENLINIDGIYISSFSQFKEVCEGNLDWNEFLGNRN